ncbi:MAG TPA: hypothetical protein VH083_21750 [Myxococcales bacterium]|jgi:hypothetical protein|nr:hypothetical protein [Myxococcales bacterium]
MANINLIGGEKGGVGKSLVSRLLAQYMIDRSLPFLGFDSDRSHGALMRFYAGYASPVVVDNYESLDAVAEAAAEDPERRILVDLAAQTHQPLARWMAESGLLEMDELSVRYWHVMDSGRDSVDLLMRLLDQFEDNLDYVVVQNELRGEDFSILEKSGQKARATALGARFIRLKKLHDGPLKKMDEHSASFWAAANHFDKSKGLGLMERQRLKIWLKHAYAEFDALAL